MKPGIFYFKNLKFACIKKRIKQLLFSPKLSWSFASKVDSFFVDCKKAAKEVQQICYCKKLLFVALHFEKLLCELGSNQLSLIKGYKAERHITKIY